jgi:hypothetical protein
MEIKRTISRIVYRIEPKPEGGFIARCSDPNVPPLEAATRFELDQQIKAKVTAEMESQVPGLKIRLDQSEDKSITLATNSNRSIFSGSDNSSPQSAEGGVKNTVEHWLEDKAVSLVEKKLPPELVEQLKHHKVDGKIKISATKVGAEGKVRSNYVVSNSTDVISRFLQGAQKNSDALEPSAPVSSSFSNVSLDSNSPITAGSGSSSFLRFLLAALVVLGMLFFFLYLKK